MSTQDQSLDLQKTELRRFAKQRGWEVHRIFEDKATGTNNNRRELKDLMSAAHKREIDVVLVWKLDRFARSLKNLLSMLQELEELGVTFISHKDQIDLSTPSGRLMAQMIGAFAEFEAAMIKERVIAGLNEAKRKGTKLGRPISIDRRKVAMLRRMGKTMAQIARDIGCSKGAIHKILNGISN